jgi:hypothetical protein
MPQNLGKKLINSHLVGGGVTEGTRFANVYPKYSEHLADLAGRIAVCDAAIKPINRVALPDGSRRVFRVPAVWDGKGLR